MARLEYNILSGQTPFSSRLTLISDDRVFYIKTHNNTGKYYYDNINNGLYELKIIDGNGCEFNQTINVDPNVTTTTTTTIPLNSIVVGNTNDPLLIFNKNAINRNNHYVGNPDPNLCEIFLWMQTYDSAPLKSELIINYDINAYDLLGNTKFTFGGVSDQIHSEIIRGNVGPQTRIYGDILLKKGFIEGYFSYNYQKGTNPSFNVDIVSSDNLLYPDLTLKSDGGYIYGIDSITKRHLIMKF